MNKWFLTYVLATLPVSTVTAKRSSPTMKRMKTYLQNGISESRLSGLAVQCSHRDSCRASNSAGQVCKSTTALQVAVMSGS